MAMRPAVAAALLPAAAAAELMCFDRFARFGLGARSLDHPPPIYRVTRPLDASLADIQRVTRPMGDTGCISASDASIRLRPDFT